MKLRFLSLLIALPYLSSHAEWDDALKKANLKQTLSTSEKNDDKYSQHKQETPKKTTPKSPKSSNASYSRPKSDIPKQTTLQVDYSSTSPLADKEALLIANADYAHFGKLPNPVPDAHQLSAALEQIGFSVNLVENASREQMLDAIGTFEERLKASRGVAFFHYGGHGVQVNGRNYLIPADAEIPDEKRVATRALELDEIMAALEASGSAASIVVLDACRDNPLPATSTRSATRGLSVIQAKPKNSIIIYAAEAGSKAQDGLFTPVLATALTIPGRPISEIMTEVRRTVYERSGGSQIPGEYNQLFEQLVLNATSASTVPPSP
jgi:uncharacterized caspase-like protein